MSDVKVKLILVDEWAHVMRGSPSDQRRREVGRG